MKKVYAKKKFGQNFLIDKNIIKKIINLLNDTNLDIIEIGPGRGALTNELVKLNNKITAFEIDKDMVEILSNNIQSSNFNLIFGDFLEQNLSEINDSIVIANIPYYITTDILFKIFDNRNKIKKAILMVQKEVAQRINAKHNTNEYSKLSVSAQFLSKTAIEFFVPSKCFSPAPKVDSAILSLEFKDDISDSDWQKYKNFFKLCFANRRKKLIFSLKQVYDLKKIENVFQKLKYNENLRIQQLKTEEIIELFNELEAN
ncbi:16S rRNA (adenine(1518)-N(6)/adenine(1519)-N(6))-dimethyltransferase RsmA [Mycoplasma leonicaptivi]|uniref:16S rRNA (adenine(1518)-N(6)/adenine(1519)-N(6))- dimethyltransferase RsmA n=1 Tax=Mycoplasma leonicaptivi TaxID=36742 RepID=UPI0005687B43|nr:16S rRNA (adenine(1518)-N(6)/adenine(1519)-N(6))-dimethyltransferase RsmA [Mycoplasma leonicaptivi]